MKWYGDLLELHNTLIYLRRRTLKLETFKYVDIEDLNRLLI